MATTVDTLLRDRLVERRRKLHSLSRADGASYLQDLLSEVDAALARMETGRFGICEACQEPIEADRLLQDPLCRLCLDHLSPSERRALEHDLELAGRIQAGLLPAAQATFDGWEVHTRYQPAGPVSGDYCDVILPPGPRAGAFVLFGDVSGKGVAASLLMCSLHAIFRSLADSGLRVDELVARANAVFSQSTLGGSFATLVCARLSASGAVELVNAGHCPPLRLRDGRVEALSATGLPVGLFPGARYAGQTVEVAGGDVLLLYTDGLSESRSPQGEEYGADRIGAVLERSYGRSAPEVTRTVLEDLAAFQDGERRADDLTVMALRRRPS